MSAAEPFGGTPITVLFFGALAERLGARQRTLETPAGGLSLTEVRRRLAAGDPAVEAALGPPVRAALDRELVLGDPQVRPGQELAFLPVFSGG